MISIDAISSMLTAFLLGVGVGVFSLAKLAARSRSRVDHPIPSREDRQALRKIEVHESRLGVRVVLSSDDGVVLEGPWLDEGEARLIAVALTDSKYADRLPVN